MNRHQFRPRCRGRPDEFKRIGWRWLGPVSDPLRSGPSGRSPRSDGPGGPGRGLKTAPRPP